MNGNFVYLSKENCRRRMDERTSIACVLPSERDTGLCSYALLFFLLEKQNLFLQKYCQQSKIKYDNINNINIELIESGIIIFYGKCNSFECLVLSLSYKIKFTNDDDFYEVISKYHYL